MALTKPTFYMSLILVFSIVITSLAYLGANINSDSRIELNEDSQNYITGMTGASGDGGYEGLADTESGATADKSWIEGEENTSYSSTDYLAALNVEKERASQTTSFFSIVYNIPATTLLSLGLPTENFKHIVNIIVYTLFVGVLITIWTKVIRG